ncbi:MAG: DUF983 domain-containing protein [Rhodospirillum sp.]|nr:DUF983 domain-containing protein [Rhodospirillum sp.]MCF8489916.1 DUF983 domain-containing protein [Rhodospirillum sp.]MCF8502526.1 DUF983 domain-containing protein [Rhodospirillum sp.]
MRENSIHSTPAPFRAGAMGRCPHCGEGRLFTGFLTLRETCDHCGLDYSFADAADGPAFVVMLLACFLTVGFALWLELAYQAPYWVHLVTTLPLILLISVPPLRPVKGLMVAIQYHHKAGEGRVVGAVVDEQGANHSGADELGADKPVEHESK